MNYVIQDFVITVCYDATAHLFKALKVVDHQASEKGRAVGKRRLIDHHGGALGLDALHHTLYGTLAKVVGVRFHGESVNAHGYLDLARGVVSIGAAVTVAARHF